MTLKTTWKMDEQRNQNSVSAQKGLPGQNTISEVEIQVRGILAHSHTHPKRGCLFIASSGKKRDLEAPASTGLGLYSGNVNPGQPNLQHGEEPNNWVCLQK
jgi:hypothetical protein